MGRLERGFWYACFTLAPGGLGYLFILGIGFGMSAKIAAAFFLGLSLANTVRFALTPQITHWLPKTLSGLYRDQALARIPQILRFEWICSALFALVFVLVALGYAQITGAVQAIDMLPFAVFCFSGMPVLFSTLYRQFISIRGPAVFMAIYWLVRCALLIPFLWGGAPEAWLIPALAGLEVLAILAAWSLIRRLGRDAETPPAQRFYDPALVQNMVGKSLIRGSLREFDILCVGAMGAASLTAEYRVLRSTAFSLIRAIGPLVELAFVKLAHVTETTVRRVWRHQKRAMGAFCLILIGMALPVEWAYGPMIDRGIANLFALDHPELAMAFKVLALTGLMQLLSVAMYPLIMQYERHRLVLASALAGAVIYVPAALGAVWTGDVTMLALAYGIYIASILAVNFWGLERHVRQVPDPK